MLNRASELQRSSPATPNPSGLTLAELEDIAREAGLDVGMLRQAASELDTTSPIATVGEKLAGGPLRIVLERTLPIEASEAVYINLVPIIESACGGAGHLSHMARTFTWNATRPNTGRTHQVRVSVRAGQTSIRIEESYGTLVGGLFGGVLGGVGGGVGLGAGPAIGFALHSIALAVALPVFVLGATYASIRYGYKAFTANRRRVLERLMQDIVDLIGEQRQLPP